ncbi:hypothetical protein [Photobacterium nomapromontoriensis]|uniref:hypothetical protein n=1 Tax=Photobacterium nomapromontoriensis TaxID=2910237 RepID=UPI003D134B2B
MGMDVGNAGNDVAIIKINDVGVIEYKWVVISDMTLTGMETVLPLEMGTTPDVGIFNTNSSIFIYFP